MTGTERSSRRFRNSYCKTNQSHQHISRIRRLVTAMSIQFQETGNVDTECSIRCRLFSSSWRWRWWRSNAGGGGGAGGYRTSFPGGTKINIERWNILSNNSWRWRSRDCVPSLNTDGSNGTPSIFSTITSTGGGGGGSRSRHQELLQVILVVQVEVVQELMVLMQVELEIVRQQVLHKEVQEE
jgi:hypothetical protein